MKQEQGVLKLFKKKFMPKAQSQEKFAVHPWMYHQESRVTWAALGIKYTGMNKPWLVRGKLALEAITLPGHLRLKWKV